MDFSAAAPGRPRKPVTNHIHTGSRLECGWDRRKSRHALTCSSRSTSRASVYLCDVGFGGEGLLLPIPLRIDQPATQFSWTYRIVTDGPFHVLQSRRGDEWLDLYAFTLEEAYPVDYEVANYYISTNPHSPFMHMIFVARPGADVRYALMNRRLIERRPDSTSENGFGRRYQRSLLREP